MLLTEGFLGWGFLGLVKHSSMLIRYPETSRLLALACNRQKG
jgi:hypothetical protein